METTTFDSHKFIKRLLSEGFTEGQAEVITDGYQQLLASRLENLSTKQDLEKVNTRLENLETRLENCATKQDLTELRGDVRVAVAEIQRDMVALKDRLSIFMWVVSFTQVGVFVVLGWIVSLLT